MHVERSALNIYEGFSFVTPVTGLNRPNTGKEDDDDIYMSVNIYFSRKANLLLEEGES
jgi:hypothetical protein